MTTMKTQNTPAKTNQEKALEAFIHHIGSARELLTLIRRRVDAHLEVDPEEVNWADVGDAAHVVEELKSIARFLSLIPEK